MGATTFGVRAAVQVIERSMALEGALRSRTEGLTWMVWGLVAAGSIVTYDSLMFRHEALDYRSNLPSLTMPLFLLWALAGVALTFTLWRSAALQAERAYGFGLHLRRLVLAGAVVLGSLLLAQVVLVVALGRLGSEPVLLGLGLAWTALAVVDPWKATPLGRRVALASGLVLVAVATAVNLLLAATQPAFLDHLAFSALRHAVMPVEAVVVGAVTFGAGLYQVMRG